MLHCEYFLFNRNAIDPNPFDLGAFLYDENPDYRQFR